MVNSTDFLATDFLAEEEIFVLDRVDVVEEEEELRLEGRGACIEYLRAGLADR